MSDRNCPLIYIVEKKIKMESKEMFNIAISSFNPEMQSIAIQARQIIHEIFPEVVEVVWVKQKNIGFGIGQKKKSEHFCWIMPATNHVNLGFNYGAELPDPTHLLEGSGKLFRHIKLKSVAQLSNPNLIALLKYATTYRMKDLKKYHSN